MVTVKKTGLPWENDPNDTGCNFALWHITKNLPERLKVDGRVHAETYVSAAGAIAGYAAQRTLFARTPPVVGQNIHRVATKSGEQYWFGDALNYMLAPSTEIEARIAVWSLAASAALSAGLPRQLVPDLDAMFKHVASTIGGPNEGRSSVPAQHQAHLPARDLLKAVWPMAAYFFEGKIPNMPHFPAPVEWWAAITAQASNRIMQDVKSVLAPHIALTLLMESAIYSSKLDQSTIEAN
jgi:hypothetical protein